MAQYLSNLPVGSLIKFGKYSASGENAQPIIWMLVAKNHGGTPSYPTNSVTLFSMRILDTRCVDAKEINNPIDARKTHGNGRYSLSNIDQWLNKDGSAGTWFEATHSADVAPSVSYVGDPTSLAYSNRPGFLNAFTEIEKRAILDTTIRVTKHAVDGGGTEDIVRKVFLPSLSEVTSESYGDGQLWEFYRINTNNLSTLLTQSAYDNMPSSYRPANINEAWSWWTRTVNNAEPAYLRLVSTYSYTGASASASSSYLGVRPALNLNASASVSDTTDSDGCYTFVANVAPSSPTTLTIPTIYGGKANTISWSSVTDPDGDNVTYQLECSYDGNTFSQIYSGASTAYSHFVTFGTIPMVYRVKATDSNGESSEYVVAAVPMVINNNPPVISGTDSDLGVKGYGFTQSYSITDADGDKVTITEAIDGSPIRSVVVSPGAKTLAVSGETWLRLANGFHTATITVTDGIDTTVRTYTFTKSVDSLSIQTNTPMEASTRPTRISIQVTRNIPSDAFFQVEVCNNGFDSSPTWEDATSSVTGMAVHLFENTTKTATKWGVLIRVTVDRNGGGGACYVSAIGGNFE